MGNIFAGSEVVEIGIQIEINGKDFYGTLAKQSKNAKVVEIFKYLADEEERHIAVFKKILEKTAKFEPQGMDADQYFAYMNALASEYVFTQKDKGLEAARAIKTDKEAVEKGIGFEKESIIFYEGIKKTVPDYDKKIVDELIAQEEKHLRDLLQLKTKI